MNTKNTIGGLNRDMPEEYQIKSRVGTKNRANSLCKSREVDGDGIKKPPYRPSSKIPLQERYSRATSPRVMSKISRLIHDEVGDEYSYSEIPKLLITLKNSDRESYRKLLTALRNSDPDPKIVKLITENLVQQYKSENYEQSTNLENEQGNYGYALLDDVRKKVFAEKRIIYKM